MSRLSRLAAVATERPFCGSREAAGVDLQLAACDHALRGAFLRPARAAQLFGDLGLDFAALPLAPAEGRCDGLLNVRPDLLVGTALEIVHRETRLAKEREVASVCAGAIVKVHIARLHPCGERR